MPQTFFKDFTRASGQPVTVEYQMDDETCAAIVAAWPNTQEYNDLHAERLELETRGGSYGRRVSVIAMDPEVRERLVELDRLIESLDETARLPDVEREEIEKSLSENHVHTSDIAF